MATSVMCTRYKVPPCFPPQAKFHNDGVTFLPADGTQLVAKVVDSHVHKWWSKYIVVVGDEMVHTKARPSTPPSTPRYPRGRWPPLTPISRPSVCRVPPGMRSIHPHKWHCVLVSAASLQCLYRGARRS